MASIYKRTDSSYFWIRYKDSSGKWKSAITPYRKDNVGCKRQAELLAREKAIEERATQPWENIKPLELRNLPFHWTAST
jgi:hypothetical protein